MDSALAAMPVVVGSIRRCSAPAVASRFHVSSNRSEVNDLPKMEGAIGQQIPALNNLPRSLAEPITVYKVISTTNAGITSGIEDDIKRKES